MFEESAAFMTISFSSKFKPSQAKRLCTPNILRRKLGFLGIFDGRVHVKGLNLKPKMALLSGNRNGISIRLVKQALAEYFLFLKKEDEKIGNNSEGSFIDFHCTTEDFEVKSINLENENSSSLIFWRMSSSEFCGYELVKQFNLFQNCETDYRLTCEYYATDIKEGLADFNLEYFIKMEEKSNQILKEMDESSALRKAFN